MLKSKHDVLLVIPQFSKKVITQFNMQVKVVYSNIGREFVNQSLATLFQENGNLHETTYVYTPQHNGVAKCTNYRILVVAWALCLTMHVPKKFWVDVVMTVIFLIN